MRTILALLLVSAAAYGQEVQVQARPESVYVETLSGDLTPIERLFFHIIVHNASKAPVDLQTVHFEVGNAVGALVSGQYSGQALMSLFGSAIDRRRIEPTNKQSLTLQPDERKAISDIFFDCPVGFIGDTLVIKVTYKTNGNTREAASNTVLQRVAGFSGRLPFNGVWYVAAEHSYQDAHKRLLSESFAYDFLQIGADGKSFRRDGSRNTDFFAYGKPVLAAKDGQVVYVQSDVAENSPGSRNLDMPDGNIVILDHGNFQFSVYAHLKPNSTGFRVGNMVRAGTIIGEVGNSGDSLEPHLHFHAMNNADSTKAAGIPVLFTDWKAQAYTRIPVTRAMGVLPRGEFVQP
jgi:hypothetical protein